LIREIANPASGARQTAALTAMAELIYRDDSEPYPT